MTPEARLVSLGLLFRILLLVAERSIGIGTFFHVDSQYYFDNAESLWLGGYAPEEVWHLATTNGYIVFVSLFFPFGVPTVGPIVLNIAMSVFSLALLHRIVIKVVPQCNLRAAYWAVLVLAILPYYAHLSIHLLKDTSFIFLSLLLLWSWLDHRIVLALLAALALFSVRSHLAMMEILVLGAAWILRAQFSFRNLTLLYLAGIALLALLGMSQVFIERGTVEFEGREFFSSLPVLRASNLLELTWMGTVAPAKSILLPNILFARNFAELMYTLDTSVTQVAIAYLLLPGTRFFHSVTSSGLAFLLTLALGGFWFVEMTTPSYGPLVRYREFFWIIFSLVILYCFFLRIRIRW